MKIFRAAVFDIDGVLAKSEIFQYKAWKQLMNEAFAYDLSMDEYIKKYCGTSSAKIAEKLAKRFKIGFTAEDILDVRENMVNKIVEQSEVEQMPYAVEAIEFFGERGVPNAFATGAGTTESIMKLEKSGLDKLVQKYEIPVVCRDQVENGKPAPDSYNEAISRLEQKNNIILFHEDVLSFEDTLPGVRSAQAAGTTCFPVVNMWTKPKFKRIKPIYENLEQVITEIKSHYSFVQPNRL